MDDSDQSPSDALASRLASAQTLYDDGVRILRAGRSTGLKLLNAAIGTDPSLVTRAFDEGYQHTLQGNDLGIQLLRVVGERDSDLVGRIYDLGIELIGKKIRGPGADILALAYHLDISNTDAAFGAYHTYQSLGDEYEHAARELIRVPLGKKDDYAFRATDVTITQMETLNPEVAMGYALLMSEAKRFHDKALLLATAVDHIRRDMAK